MCLCVSVYTYICAHVGALTQEEDAGSPGAVSPLIGILETDLRSERTASAQLLSRLSSPFKAKNQGETTNVRHDSDLGEGEGRKGGGH